LEWMGNGVGKRIQETSTDYSGSQPSLEAEGCYGLG
jgi:hypothetical protein